MQRHQIPLSDLVLRPFHTFDKRWFLLTAGTLDGGYNPMTISWGAVGTVWNRPFALVLVRPTRHTFGFMERGQDFTLSMFPDALRKPIHGICGVKSGRDMDKVAACGLSPIPSTEILAPAFDEAELVLECRQIYRADLDPKLFMDPAIHDLYDQDHHRFWFGEVVAAHGTRDWRAGG